MMEVQKVKQVPEVNIREQEQWANTLINQYINELGVSAAFKEELEKRKSIYIQLFKDNIDQYYL